MCRQARKRRCRRLGKNRGCSRHHRPGHTASPSGPQRIARKRSKACASLIATTSRTETVRAAARRTGSRASMVPMTAQLRAGGGAHTNGAGTILGGCPDRSASRDDSGGAPGHEQSIDAKNSGNASGHRNDCMSDIHQAPAPRVRAMISASGAASRPIKCAGQPQSLEPKPVSGHCASASCPSFRAQSCSRRSVP